LAGTVDVCSLLVVVDKAEVFDLQLLSKFKKMFNNKLKRILKLVLKNIFLIKYQVVK